MNIRRTRTGATVAFGLLCIFAMPAAAQQAPVPAAPKAEQAKPAQPLKRLADGHPDLNGFWASTSGPDTPVGATFGPRDPNAKRGAGGAKERSEDPNQPPYKPELMDKVKNFAKFETKYDPAFFCKPGGVPRIGPPHGILQVAGLPIVLLYQAVAGNTFRVIPMDGRAHDADADPTYFGDPVGHWEGDTLVIDSVNFNDDTWFGLDGWFHSTDLHVIERITREGDTIRYQATIDDPTVFTRPWVMNPRIGRATTEIITENAPCVERDISHVTDFGEKTNVK
jgi:hypothetical protein